MQELKAESNLIRLQDRMLPNNLDAEMAILGGCLLDPNAIDRVADHLPAEAFYQAAHREIYRAMLVLHADGKQVDLMSVYSWLVDHKLLEKVGSKTKLVELVESSVSAVNVDLHAALVVEKYNRRRLIQVGNAIAQLGLESATSLSDACDQAEQKLFEVTQQQQGAQAIPASEIVGPVFHDLVERSEGVKQPGLTCGFYDLDAMTQGFQRSDLIILAGRASMGKTAFALNIAENVATEHQLPVLIFSMEMDREQLIGRLMSSNSRIELGRMRSGRLIDQDWDALGLTVSKIANTPLFIDDKFGVSVSHMRSTARRLQAEAGQLGMILVDYLGLVEGGGENRVQELSKITRDLKGMARELKVPVIVLSQLNRAVEQRQDKRPMMSDLRESGSIEQDADVVMLLYRAEYYDANTPDRGIAEVIIAKARNGPTGTVKLLFENQFTQFRNLATPRRAL